MHLTENERVRYSRHIALPEIGMQGQIKLKQARVLIVGAGGLGSPAGLYLAAAGIGHIGIMDDDFVSLSNLQRQILYSSEQIQTPKTRAAKNRLNSLNPEIEIQTYTDRLTSQNALDIISSYDVVIDGTDNFSSRYLINDACVLAGKPNVYGTIFGFDGQASLFYPPQGPCYRCLFPHPLDPDAVPNCNENGVLGVLPGVIGTIQATEAIKFILGIGITLQGRILTFDALRMNFTTVRLKNRIDCPSCGKSPLIHSMQEHSLNASDEVSLEELYQRLKGDPLSLHLVDVRSQEEYEAGHIDGAIHIPIDQLSERMNELSTRNEIVVYCRSGLRSLRAEKLLNSNGNWKVSRLVRYPPSLFKTLEQAAEVLRGNPFA